MPPFAAPRSRRVTAALALLCGLLLVVGSPATRPVLSAGSAH